MIYKEEIYRRYRSSHNDLLYGRPTKTTFEKSFKLWQYYYGRHLPASRSARLLDIGCGEGGFVYFLRETGYSQVEGIDISIEQIELGKSLMIEGLQQGDLRNHLRNATARYDFIVARDVIEHFSKQEAFDILKEVANALKPGGAFAMQVPNGEGLFMSSIYFGDYTHEVAYSWRSVRQLFLNTGFASAACYPVNPAPFSVKGSVRLLLWHFRVAVHRFWKAVETGSTQGIFTSNLIAIGKK